MKKPLVWALFVFSAIIGGSAPSPLQNHNLQRELGNLNQRGITYRFLSDDRIELTYPVSGEKRVKSLRQPGEETIRSWASSRGVPILEIDPNTVDTSQYTGWFRYWSQVPLSNDSGEPLVVADADRNGEADVYGIYLDNGSDLMARIYQVDSSGAVSLGYDFSPRVGIAEAIIDADQDSLREFTLSYGGSIFDFEQSTRTSLPTSLQFIHTKNQGFLDPGYTRSYFGNLDNDSLIDFLYKGSERDSVDTTLAHGKVYVAEYSDAAGNFVRNWSKEYIGGGEGGLSGFAVDDFDQDGKQEFAVSDLISGKVFVTENDGDNNYELVWEDSVPFVNIAYLGSGDVDHDGKPELFVGATMSNGNWTTVFESDSDNHLSPRLIIHFLSGGTFDNPQYMITDVDGDGKRELVVCSGRDIYFFKSNQDNQYYLWYLKRENARDGIQFYDFNKDGRKDFIVSKSVYVDPPGYFRFYADIYVGTPLVQVTENHHSETPDRITLNANFPNPFNPSTTIEFSLISRSSVSLKIYDLSGKEVVVLLDKIEDAGTHSVRWDVAGRSSGVYFCCLRAGSTTLTRKLVLLH